MFEKENHKDELQFLGVLLIFALIAIFALSVGTGTDTSGYAAQGVATSTVAPMYPAFCVKSDISGSVFSGGVTTYRDAAGNKQTVQDFCRNYQGSIIVQWTCVDNSLRQTERQCPTGTICQVDRCVSAK